MTLKPRADGPRWEIEFSDGERRLADPATGQLMPRLGAADAAKELRARYIGPAKVTDVSRVDPDSPPLELRRAMNGWRIAMDDGTHFYVDGGSGEIIARRTSWWHFYDFMWGLHIMDLQTREDSHNPFVIVFGSLALLGALLGTVLLFRRRKVRASA